MKKGILALGVTALVLLGGPALAPAKDSKQVTPGSWSGTWTLDFGQSRNLPSGLDSYSMSVHKDGQELKVETSLRGDLHPAEDASGPYPSRGNGTGYPRPSGGIGAGTGVGVPGAGGGYPRGGIYPGGGYPGGGGYPDDSTGYPGGRGGGSPHGSRDSARGGITALRMYPRSAVYKLDGTAATAQLGDSDQTEATSKVESTKNGAELKISLAAASGPGQKGDAIQLKDQWKFSKDGRYLIVDRSVRAPEGSGNLHLVFRRQAEDSAPGAAPAPSN